jgi:hypothetical protein
VLDATFARPALTSFCRLDGLGLEVLGQRLEADRAVLACRVTEPDRWCRRCGCEGVVRDSVTRKLAHEPFGWRPTMLLVTVCRYRCSGCGHVWRQDTSRAAEPRATLSRGGLRWALSAIVCQHLTVARVAEACVASTATRTPGGPTSSHAGKRSRTPMTCCCSCSTAAAPPSPRARTCARCCRSTHARGSSTTTCGPAGWHSTRCAWRPQPGTCCGRCRPSGSTPAPRDEWYLDLGAEAYVQELRAVGVSEDVLHHETYDQTHAVPTSQYVKALRYLLRSASRGSRGSRGPVAGGRRGLKDVQHVGRADAPGARARPERGNRAQRDDVERPEDGGVAHDRPTGRRGRAW